MSLRQLLTQHISQAMSNLGIPSSCEPHIAPSKNVNFGDYQANGAMAAAKIMGQNPRELAQKICAEINLAGMISSLEVAGPGFINIHLNSQWLGSALGEFNPEQPLKTSKAQTIVVDYSGPNLAKEMHVGHLRSTIIGDAVVRVLEFLGHTVIRQNHVGDWGTQFGMLLAELENQMNSGEQADLALKDLEVFYQQAKKHFDENEQFANKAREYVVRLQSGDAHLLELWKSFRTVSLHHSEEIYQLLGVSLNTEHTQGESAYNEYLAPLVENLQRQGLAVNDDGAKVVFLSELADKKGNPSPVIVQKKDGGFLYATTDLAALQFRAQQLCADRILYFIDARQSLHMQQVFTLSKKAGLVPQQTRLEHHPFGTMMGEDNKPFKTRTGGTVKLADLLIEATERALAAVQAKNPNLSTEEQTEVAKTVGIGAIKYADLSKTRTLDYVFNWDNMLSFEGNTGPYLQYAYTRVASLLRNAGIHGDGIELNGSIEIIAPQEKALALKLLQFSDTVEQVAEDAMPHSLCTYLYELASLFMSFYEACPILKTGAAIEARNSRLLLSHKVALTLKTGLGLLGINVLEKM
ncbi:MAG TPA: arginine--tRNA ligase [Cellvibrionaceae bacterium]